MKNIRLIFIVTFGFQLLSCTHSDNDKVRKYLKENLKNPTSYEPISSDSLKHYSTPDTLLSNRKLVYHTLIHRYRVKNSDGVLVPMSVMFAFDKEMNIIATGPDEINGNYNSIKGTVSYESLDNYKDLKPDHNAEIVFFPTDSLRKGISFKTVTDMQGNYTIEKILPGQYTVILRSGNAPFCPTTFLFSGLYILDDSTHFSINAEQVNRLFGFDFRQLPGFLALRERGGSLSKHYDPVEGSAFEQDCFRFYQTFQTNLPSIFFQGSLEHSSQIEFGNWVTVDEKLPQTKNFKISSVCQFPISHN